MLVRMLVTGVPAQQVVKHGERTTATGTPGRKYYTFKGWATTADATEPNFTAGPSGTPRHRGHYPLRSLGAG